MTNVFFYSQPIIELTPEAETPPGPADPVPAPAPDPLPPFGFEAIALTKTSQPILTKYSFTKSTKST